MGQAEADAVRGPVDSIEVAATWLAQVAVPRDVTLVEWLGDVETWTGPTGILASLVDTLILVVAVIATSILLAVPAAAYLAHQ